MNGQYIYTSASCGKEGGGGNYNTIALAATLKIDTVM